MKKRFFLIALSALLLTGMGFARLAPPSAMDAPGNAPGFFPSRLKVILPQLFLEGQTQLAPSRVRMLPDGKTPEDMRLEDKTFLREIRVEPSFYRLYSTRTLDRDIRAERILKSSVLK
jgi:hypothetical protein